MIRVKSILAVIALMALAGCVSSPPLTANLDTYKASLIEYAHDGAYAADQARVGREAEAWLTEESGRVRKPAIVLDIDETSLSNWNELAANGLTFRMDGPCDALPKGPCGLTAWNRRAEAAAIQPTLHLFYAARRLHVPVFFITGRDESVRAATELNLRRAGYKDWTQLIMRPAGSKTPSATDYKAPQRAHIEAQGYDIILNIGDQPSDLAGGYAERTFLMPNPFYRIR